MRIYAYYMADLTRSRTASHGIINYSLGLLSGLAVGLEKDEQLVVLGTDHIKQEMGRLLPDLSRIEWHETEESSPMMRLVTDHVRSLQWARQAGADVLHFPKGFIPIRCPDDLRIVATVHDDIPVRYAEGHFGPEAVSRRYRYFAAAIKHTLRKANAVLAVSEFTKERLEILDPGHRAPILVTHEGAHPLVTKRGHSWPKENHLLVFGSTHPHKRTAETVEYAAKYLENSELDLDLLVLGRVTPEVAALIESIPGARNQKGFLETGELVETVADARALLWGSAYEGFGLPPLEAGILGTPVVFRSIPAVAEVMDGTHFPFEDSFDNFAAALDSALAAPETDLSAYGEHLASRFGWDTIAERTLTAYREDR